MKMLQFCFFKNLGIKLCILKKKKYLPFCKITMSWEQRKSKEESTRRTRQQFLGKSTLIGGFRTNFGQSNRVKTWWSRFSFLGLAALRTWSNHKIITVLALLNIFLSQRRQENESNKLNKIIVNLANLPRSFLPSTLLFTAFFYFLAKYSIFSYHQENCIAKAKPNFKI